MTKAQFITELTQSAAFSDTYQLVGEVDGTLDWTKEEIKQLVSIALYNAQVRGTLNYSGNTSVKEFYQALLDRYSGEVDESIEELKGWMYLIPKKVIASFLEAESRKVVAIPHYRNKNWQDAETGLEFTVCDGLYHANSVSTALSYIKQKKMYSRKYGDAHFADCQTAQWSDDLDREYGIYNDIFFDNCDCRLLSNSQSVYGPVTIVLDRAALFSQPLKVRIMKSNPGMDDRDWTTLPYEEKFFTSIEDLREYADEGDYLFATKFQHHTTLWNQAYIPLNSEVLKFILVERHSEDIQVSIRIKEVLEEALRGAGLENIPVVIRNNVVPADNHGSNATEVLWNIPVL